MNFEIGAMTDTRFELCGAVLVYSNPDGDNICSWHEADNSGELSETGRPLDLAEILRRAKIELDAEIPELIPPGLLSFGSNMLIWRKRSCIEPLFLKTKDQKLNRKSGTKVHWPDLLFAAHANGSLFVYVTFDRDITARTQLYLPPFYNFFESGRLCTPPGRKAGIRISDIPENEKIFFESYFSHPDEHDLCSKAWDLTKILKYMLAGNRLKRSMLKKYKTLDLLMEELK